MAVKNPTLPMNVKTLCLGSLCLMDGTGYDIKKLFEEAFSHFHSASYGSIYPSLNQLQRDGLIDLRVEPGTRHPDRKVYSITEAGRRAFMEEIVQTEPTEQLRSELMVLLFFAHLLPTERLAELLDQACRHYREALAYLESLQECDIPVAHGFSGGAVQGCTVCGAEDAKQGASPGSEDKAQRRLIASLLGGAATQSSGAGGVHCDRKSVRDGYQNTAGIRFVIGLGTATLQAKLAFVESQRDSLLEEHRAVPRSWLEKKS